MLLNWILVISLTQSALADPLGLYTQIAGGLSLGGVCSTTPGLMLLSMSGGESRYTRPEVPGTTLLCQEDRLVAASRVLNSDEVGEVISDLTEAWGQPFRLDPVEALAWESDGLAAVIGVTPVGLELSFIPSSENGIQ